MKKTNTISLEDMQELTIKMIDSGKDCNEVCEELKKMFGYNGKNGYEINEELHNHWADIISCIELFINSPKTSKQQKYKMFKRFICSPLTFFELQQFVKNVKKAIGEKNVLTILSECKEPNPMKFDYITSEIKGLIKSYEQSPSEESQKFILKIINNFSANYIYDFLTSIDNDIKSLIDFVWNYGRKSRIVNSILHTIFTSPNEDIIEYTEKKGGLKIAEHK